MSDLPSLHSQATKLILSLREGVERLESTDLQYSSPALIREMQRRLEELRKISSSMDSMWRMHVVKEASSKRDIWKRKVEQVSEEYDVLRASLDRYAGKVHKRQTEEEMRQSLMSRSTGADFIASTQRESEMDAAAGRSIHRSKMILEEAFQTGTAILENMGATRERLKTAQRKLFDVLNSLGLSDSVLRMAERRQSMDKLIVYGGMALLTLLFVVLVWWAVSHKRR